MKAKSSKTRSAKTSPRRLVETRYDSALGCVRGELMLVEYAAKKAAKELREIADRIERIASCTQESYERINPNRE